MTSHHLWHASHMLVHVACITHASVALHAAINQSISQWVQCPVGQLGPNRQKVQFSEFIHSQIRFALYMQSISSGIHPMHLVHTKS